MSRMYRKVQVRFLGGKEVVTPLTYPTLIKKYTRKVEKKMAVTMSQLLGKPGDVIEDCRKEIRLLPSNDRYRISAEILLRNGERRYFRAKSIDRKSATQEVLLFIAAVENATGETVMWRLKGEKTYHMSTNYEVSPSFIQRTKKAILGYFFDIEE